MPPLYQERQAQIAACLSGEIAKLATAMLEIDASTDPDVLRFRKKQSAAEDIEQLTTFLRWRVTLRAAWAIERRPFEPPTTQDRDYAVRAKRVERRFRQAIVAALPPPPHTKRPFDVRRFETMFAAFVAGELATSRVCPKLPANAELEWHGMPDGANFFSFAEAALLFMRLDLHAEFWALALPSLVCGSQFFAANYWSGQSRMLKDYSAKHLLQATPSHAILAMLNQFYGAMNPPRLAEEFGNLLGIALANEPRSHLTPNSPEFP